ncbi:PREDICTED: cyclin-D4-1-like isoform X2 [Ipomoea nil]|uniref:cyclin-D4-1-like isoform X2 n=1 Tax=Ipomoea nil TaxID=35883 RepID=UPI00090158C0|nr:PREDICTED: cyclin-D4-1-like isoform X2 [Ipomoea nil]
MPEISPSNAGMQLEPVPDPPFIVRVFESEHNHVPHPDYRLQLLRHRPVHLAARQDSINWILKVHAHYHFNPATAFLSINYFDRFLSLHTLPVGGWPLQLLSVACLSLAAKMEEPNAPVLMDLQLFDPKYVFEPRTIQKMELRVMHALNWRLHSVTPFDYLDYFISELRISRPSDPRRRFEDIIRTFSDFVLNTAHVTDFLGFPPSVIAAAAVITAVGDAMDIPESFYNRVNKEKVRSCHRLMEEYLAPPPPPADAYSPCGVLDATDCGSCDTRSEDPALVSATSSVAAPIAGGDPPPELKRLKPSTADVQEEQ